MERVVQFWNERPCNIRHSSKELGTREYYNEVEAKKYKAEPHIPDFADFEQWKGERVLEIGCGIGTDTTNFCRAGADYTGIDLTDRAVEIASQRLDVFGLSGKLSACDAEKSIPSHPSGSYDLVYSFGVIHHTPNPRAVIDNIAAVVKAGAELRLMLYSKWSYKLFWVMHEYDESAWDFGESADAMMARYAEAQTGCPVAYTYTFNDVEKLLAPHFQVKKIWKDHIFPFQIEPYKKGEFKVVDEFSTMSEERFNSMCRELGWHTLVIAKRL
jgi:SAM-dependent methyltransferase